MIGLFGEVYLHRGASHLKQGALHVVRAALLDDQQFRSSAQQRPVTAKAPGYYRNPGLADHDSRSPQPVAMRLKYARPAAARRGLPIWMR
jgi:hypothetical protein